MSEIKSPHTTAKSSRTKKKIIEAFLTLFEKKKWDKISVKEICVKADITRGTFYQYFTDIYEMMEEIESSILNELTAEYNAIPKRSQTFIPPEQFDEKYDVNPPKSFLIWFDFCSKHKLAINSLLDRNNGDPYFVKKLKTLINKNLNYIMNCDGLPNDNLRVHFVKVLTELHFIAVQEWLGDEDSNISVNEIVNLLNVARIGGSYLSNRTLKLKNKEKQEEGNKENI
ncbi:MAG: TetR/AcrR family transcriptional regulator [Lachnospiraceae bacterium]|jgi:AcrR family transcriptional regulator|nr:TetR/AcrR family transcriptional regulator [Lachnospiraceae bacterium]